MHLSAFLQFEHFADCSIREYQSIQAQYSETFNYYAIALCQHNTLAYYAFIMLVNLMQA